MIVLGPGDRSDIVSMVKRRLSVYPVDDMFTDELASHVRGAQMRLGMDPSGLVDDDLLEGLFISQVSRPRGSL